MGLYYYIKLAREDKKDQPKVKKIGLLQRLNRNLNHTLNLQKTEQKKPNSIKTEVPRNQDDQKGKQTNKTYRLPNSSGLFIRMKRRMT